MKTLIVIPAYNEEESIVKTVNKLKLVIENQSKYEIDYVVINDGSSDNTEKILKENNIKHISHISNLGLDGAIKTGIRYSIVHNYDNVMQFDADGQHNAEYVIPLIDVIADGYDIAIGSRFKGTKKHWSLRMLGSKVLSNLIYFKSKRKQKITDPTSGQRIINASIKELCLKCTPSEPSFVIRYLNKGFKVKEIQVEMNDRELGESKFNAINSIEYMLEQCLSIILGF